MNRKAYLQWCIEDSGYEYIAADKESETQSLFDNGPIRYILMSEEELKSFIEFQYDMEGMYQRWLRRLYEE